MNSMREDLDRAMAGVCVPAQLRERILSGGEGRRRSGPYSRIAALAACLLLAVCLVRFDAVAARAGRLLRSLTGLGAVPDGAAVLVQREPLTWTQGDRLYLVEDAFQRGGFVYVPVEVLSRSGERTSGGGQGSLFLQAQLSSEGRAFDSVWRAVWPEETVVVDNGKVQTPFLDLHEWEYLSGRYGALGYRTCASHTYTFRADLLPEEGYVLHVRDYAHDLSWDHTLELAEPEAVDAVCASRAVGEGTVTALAAADGRSVSFYAELDPARTGGDAALVQLWVNPASGVTFVDEYGNRYPGALRRFGNTERYNPVVLLPEEPEGKIVSIEVHELGYNLMDTGDRREQERSVYEDLGWTIEIP